VYWGFYTVAADGVLLENETRLTKHEEGCSHSRPITQSDDAGSQTVSSEPPLRKASFTVTFIGPPPQPWFPKQ
jgi:hypothetical protein